MQKLLQTQCNEVYARLWNTSVSDGQPLSFVSSRIPNMNCVNIICCKRNQNLNLMAQYFNYEDVRSLHMGNVGQKKKKKNRSDDFLTRLLYFACDVYTPTNAV